MNLPNADLAYVDGAKITGYLLSTAHPDGRSKANFFARFGFTVENWPVLANALGAVARSNAVVSISESEYGARYTVDGPLNTPDGRTPTVRTVWIIASGSVAPRLITAHPLQEGTRR
jgi:hypothetical protein